MKYGVELLGPHIPPLIEVGNDDLRPGDLPVETFMRSSGSWVKSDNGIIEGWKPWPARNGLASVYPYGRPTSRAPLTSLGDGYRFRVARFGQLATVRSVDALPGDIVFGFWLEKEPDEENWYGWLSGPEQAMGWEVKNGQEVMVGERHVGGKGGFMFDRLSSTLLLVRRAGAAATGLKAASDDPFPHRCLYCGRKAYVSALSVEHADGRSCNG